MKVFEWRRVEDLDTKTHKINKVIVKDLIIVCTAFLYDSWFLSRAL